MSKPRTRLPVEVVDFVEPGAQKKSFGGSSENAALRRRTANGFANLVSKKKEKQTRKRQRQKEEGGSKKEDESQVIPNAPRELDEKVLKRQKERAWKDVLELGQTGHGKRERKAHEAKKLKQQGFTVTNPKEPLNIMFSRAKTHKKRAEKRQQEIKESGVVVAQPTKKRKSTASRHKRRPDEIHKWNDGNFHRGMLRLNKDVYGS